MSRSPKKAKVKVIELDEKGYGIAKLNNRKIKVLGGLPGEIVLVEIRRKRKAKILDIIESPYRRLIPICPYYGVCGGCIWQTIPYKKQLALKQEILERLFKREYPRVDLRRIIPSPRIYGYRSKMEFAFVNIRGALGLGLREHASYDRVVDIRGCWLQSRKANRVLFELRNSLSILGYKPYNILTHQGFLRYLTIRYSHSLGETLVNIVTTSKNNLDLEYLARNSSATTITWVINDGYADTAYGTVKDYVGKGYLIEIVSGYRFKICPQCFYQSNPLQARRLFKLVRAYGDSGKVAYDLYSGIGTIAILISDNFDRVYGIEEYSESVQTAIENARINDVTNTEFLNGKVEQILPSKIKKADVIFLDPPRPGVHKNALKAIIEIAPSRIVYVSCNPSSQLKDIRILTEHGYSLEFIQPIDMLPHTPHIETIAVLDKK